MLNYAKTLKNVEESSLGNTAIDLGQSLFWR